jgi:hypothetical protein
MAMRSIDKATEDERAYYLLSISPGLSWVSIQDPEGSMHPVTGQVILLELKKKKKPWRIDSPTKKINWRIDSPKIVKSFIILEIWSQPA